MAEVLDQTSNDFKRAAILLIVAKMPEDKIEDLYHEFLQKFWQQMRR